MRTYKKKYNKNNNNSKKNKLKGGSTFGLAMLIPQLLGLVPQIITVGEGLAEKYKSPPAIVDLSTKVIKGLIDNATIKEQLLKKDGQPNPSDNTDYKQVYHEAINILKGIEGPAVTLFEEVLGIFCGQQDSLKELLHKPALSTAVKPVKEGMKLVAEMLESEQNKIKAEVEKINKDLSAKFSFIIKNIIGLLKGELDVLITVICKFLSSESGAGGVMSSMFSSFTGTSSSNQKGSNKPAAGKPLTAEDIKELRRVKTNMGLAIPIPPVLIKGSKLIITPEKLKEVLHGEDMSVEDTDEKFNFGVEKHDGINIGKLTVEKQYPLRIHMDVKKDEPLVFLLVPDSEPLRYQLASNQKILKSEIETITMPPFMKGKTAIRRKGTIGKKQNIELHNFKLKYKKVFQANIKQPYNFFNIVDDLKNPTYELNEKFGGKKNNTKKKR